MNTKYSRSWLHLRTLYFWDCFNRAVSYFNRAIVYANIVLTMNCPRIQIFVRRYAPWPPKQYIVCTSISWPPAGACIYPTCLCACKALFNMLLLYGYQITWRWPDFAKAGPQADVHVSSHNAMLIEKTR